MGVMQGVAGAAGRQMERQVGRQLEKLMAARLDSGTRSLAVAWPGGRVGPGDAKVLLRFRATRWLTAMAQARLGDLAEAYVRGELDIEGSMRDLMAAAAALVQDPTSEALVSPWRRLWQHWRSRRHHDRAHDAQQVQFHYDVSDDFYALWLDPRRVYSCAYWPAGVNDLAAAQEAKLDLICRKLKLEPGLRFLDIGAGWGGLLLWAAEHYGVQAHGVTLSKHQHAHVSRLIQARGLTDRVRMELLDYRDIACTDWGRRPFDRIASVGMFEHVGDAQLPGYFSTLQALLAPGGLMLNHGITAGGLHNHQLGAGMGDFVERHIFPGGELVHVSRVTTTLAEGGLELLDAENLRPPHAVGLVGCVGGPSPRGCAVGAARDVAGLSALPGRQRDELRTRLAGAVPTARRPAGSSGGAPRAGGPAGTAECLSLRAQLHLCASARPSSGGAGQVRVEGASFAVESARSVHPATEGHAHALQVQIQGRWRRDHDRARG